MRNHKHIPKTVREELDAIRKRDDNNEYEIDNQIANNPEDKKVWKRLWKEIITIIKKSN